MPLSKKNKNKMLTIKKKKNYTLIYMSPPPKKKKNTLIGKCISSPMIIEVISICLLKKKIYTSSYGPAQKKTTFNPLHPFVIVKALNFMFPL